ncbi:TIGR02647 family protein [Uliginosibacterium sediminicola]|uniref:TIGR02647 family protein n=1 Tax=Uliginosibacterium sediminicola TaxID=2024550 RepID=A0ABU9YYR3_9RHOO
MRFTPELIEELNTLARFDLATNQQGIKIHKTAEPAIIATCQRLHRKGLITQVDGGYLTPLGRDAAEHAEIILSILTSRPNGVSVEHSETVAYS